MTLIEAGEFLAEMCYTQVYPDDYNIEAINYDFEIEIDLIRTEPGYLDNLGEETRQLNVDVANKWNAANEFDQKVVIEKLVKMGIIPKGKN